MTSAQGTGSLGTPNLLRSDQPDTEARSFLRAMRTKQSG